MGQAEEDGPLHVAHQGDNGDDDPIAGEPLVVLLALKLDLTGRVEDLHHGLVDALLVLQQRRSR